MPLSLLSAIGQSKAALHHVRRQPTVKSVLKVIYLYLKRVSLIPFYLKHFSNLVQHLPPPYELLAASKSYRPEIYSLLHSVNAHASAQSSTSLCSTTPTDTITFFFISTMFFIDIVATISWHVDMPHWQIRNCSDLSLFLGFLIGS